MRDEGEWIRVILLMEEVRYPAGLLGHAAGASASCPICEILPRCAYPAARFFACRRNADANSYSTDGGDTRVCVTELDPPSRDESSPVGAILLGKAFGRPDLVFLLRKFGVSEGAARLALKELLDRQQRTTRTSLQVVRAAPTEVPPCL